MRIGIIGTGAIAPAYLKGMALFPESLNVVACADIQEERAQAFAATHSLEARSLANLLASDDIDLILNLTIPAAHADVSLQILQSGKHVYSEKPLAVTVEDGRRIVGLAQEKGLRVGCAPDTFLGAGGQTARRLIEAGAIGKPVAATAFMMGRGPDSWHPNPFFYYVAGGGPMLDMGPYYLTALVNLLGPIETVTGISGRGVEGRVAGHESVRGQPIPISVNTHIAGMAQFEQGAIATLIMSFDVWAVNLPRIEIYGTEGSLSVPDPNNFDGAVKLWQPENHQWQDVESVHRPDVLRGIGVADMADAIQENKPHRASGEMALHVLETMLAFEESSTEKQHVRLTTRTSQPEALAPNLVKKQGA
jgi:predicted dehydrogenase